MRKIFFALILTSVCLVTLTTTVAAQDVWISSGGNGTDWYIIDETIEGDATGKFRWTNVDTKLVADDGSCIGVTWKFTQVDSSGGSLANWVYSTIWDNKPYAETEVLSGTNAEKILIYCMNRLRM